MYKEEVLNSYNESDLKIYLTKVVDGVEEVVIYPVLLSEFGSGDEKYLYSDEIDEGVITYRLRIWLKEDFNFNDYITKTTTDGVLNINLEQYEYKFKINISAYDVIDEDILVCDFVSEDESGANPPELPENTIPICYNSEENVWLRADETNQNSNFRWYSYSDKAWANIATLTGDYRDDEYWFSDESIGDVIPLYAEDANLLDGVLTMWVWVPRFSATGDYTTYNGTNNISSPGAFDITFVNKNTSAHEAFTFGNSELSGFWMGKYQLSSISVDDTVENDLGCVDNNCENGETLKMIPYLTPLQNNDVSNYFYAIKSMENSDYYLGFNGEDVDIHLTKNSEWGAVAYLSQSIYGRCSSSLNCQINNSSTNHNETGIMIDEDYSFPEFVMGVYTDDENNLYTGGYYGATDVEDAGFYTSGFNGCIGVNHWLDSGENNGCYELKTDGIDFPESKYYNTYTNTQCKSNSSCTTTNPETNYTSSMQHALRETFDWYDWYDYYEEYYDVDVLFVNPENPWFVRGGGGSMGYQAHNLFCYSSAAGVYFSARPVLVN